MKVSFDFDSTLSRPCIQGYAQELISRGVDVWVTTSRNGDCKSFGMYIDNDDLYTVTDALNIPRENIIFTCGVSKSAYIRNHNFIFHLDDDSTELLEIRNAGIDTIGISCWNNSSWKKKCERTIERKAKRPMA